MTPADTFDAVMAITARPPLVYVDGHGSWLTDQHDEPKVPGFPKVCL